MKHPASLALTLIFGVCAVGFGCAANSDLETSPGPAFQTVEGKLNKIDGNVYVVDEYITDYRGEEVKEKEVRVYVNNETKKPHGNKKVGDKVRVEVTRNGFANSVQ